MISKLLSLLSRRDKVFLFYLFIISILVSFVETVGISAIMPFISVATDFSRIHENQYLQAVYLFLNFQNDASFVIAFGIALIAFYVFRSLFNLMYFYLLSRFSMGRYHVLALRLFQNYLNFFLKDFVTKNTADLTKAIINEASHLTGLLQNILLIMSEIVILIILYSVLLFVNYKITLLLSLILFINSLLFSKTISSRIKREGKKRELFQSQLYRIINSSFGNFKIIKLLNMDKTILNDFSYASYGYAVSNIRSATLSHIPRLFLEMFGFSLVAFVVAYLVYMYQTDIRSSIPIISMYVLALYRMLPSVNRIMSSYNASVYVTRSLEIVHSDLFYKIEENGDEPIFFKKCIEMKELSFGFKGESNVLKDLNLQIEKGESIAFIGESGCGKSTLVDLLMGLYKPLSGEIFVDGVALSSQNVNDWRAKIGYIPQHIYLFDGSVGENVLMGRPLDADKMNNVLMNANIWDFLNNREGIDTKVGEGGIQLSGGQKQRIAIARALYGDPQILILDEATSALDDETENKIMNEIYDACSDKTLIIVAHRLTTIKRCKKAYRLAKGSIIEENFK